VEVAIVILGTLLAVAVTAATVGWQRVGRAERHLGARAKTVRALADLVAGRRG